MKILQVKVWNDRKVPNVFRKTAPCCTWFGAQMVVEHRAGPWNTSLQVPGIRAAAKGPDPHSPAFLLWIKFISICFLDSFGSFTIFFFLFLLFDWINIIPRDSIWTSGSNTISLERSAVQKKKRSNEVNLLQNKGKYMLSNYVDQTLKRMEGNSLNP